MPKPKARKVLDTSQQSLAQKQSEAAIRVFMHRLEEGTLQIQCRLEEGDERVPGVPVGGWIFGRLTHIGKVTTGFEFGFLGDSVPPSVKR